MSQVGVLLGIAVVVAAATGSIALGQLESHSSTVDRISMRVVVDPASDRISLVHVGGHALDVRRIQIRVWVDSRPLAHQPPVPFFAASGFRGGPTGPFNSAADPIWTVGERAGFRIASTNRPHQLNHTVVTVRILRDGRPVAVAQSTDA